mmetsp:Transcript_2772/g.5096  ORF Transcript_2772/g.5096 Transcript_2772/m.5096 type:complete len:86 (-) Transcript_2772:790-1047(-)
MNSGVNFNQLSIFLGCSAQGEGDLAGPREKIERAPARSYYASTTLSSKDSALFLKGEHSFDRRPAWSRVHPYFHRYLEPNMACSR